MALVLADRVKETTTTTGTGALALGGAVTDFQSFAIIGNGNTTYYTVAGGTDWEVGIGTYSTTGPSISRDTILASSNNGSVVNLASGGKYVFCTLPASVFASTVTDAQAAASAAAASATSANNSATAAGVSATSANNSATSASASAVTATSASAAAAASAAQAQTNANLILTGY